MEFSSFLSSLRSVTDQLDKVGDPQLSTVVPQTFSPHTRIDRAKASSQSLSQTQQILKSLGDHLIQTELFRDSLRLEYARAINSLCPALQLPEEVLRAVFIFRAEDEHPNDMFLIHICRQWRATALACPQLWTTIYTSDSLPMIQRALQLSSNHPLDLIFSRTPPQNLRKFENEMGSMQVLVDQIQTRSISNLLVEGDGINDNIDLRGAFGRGSILSVLHVESIDISYAQSRKYLDMQHVEFPCCRHFTVEGSSLPILGTSQLSCQFLTIIALTAIPHYFIDFLLGFKALEDIEFREIGIRDLPSHPLPLPTLENLLLSRLTANVFMLLSGVVRMEDIYSVYLSEFLTYGAEDKSASALMSDAQALTRFLAQPVGFPH
ncbi:hypothetical protein DL93DRAFT_304360 [Clavulina sp. PMI_390]|nr:hypothetical protein DL93DRAFT_304360 [Clavulina sp. PMI_390]